MKLCKSCKVKIMDDTDICPLCRQVLFDDHTEEDTLPGHMYPDVITGISLLRLVENIFLFLTIVAVVSMGCLVYWEKLSLSAALVVGFVLLYINTVLRLTLLEKNGYMFKMISFAILSTIALEGIDFMTGDRGWAMEIAWPVVVLLYDCGILVLMILNNRNWQSYIVYQLIAILLSGVPAVLLALGRINYGYVITISVAVSLLLFAGTVIIGDRRARTELKRRFHI